LIRALVGISLIGLGIFLEILWLGVCFGTVIIGILLLIFAPQILFFPFTFFSVLGFAFLKAPSQKYTHSHTHYDFNNNYEEPIINTNLSEYYQILESDPNDDFITIKNNYRRLMKEYHYDTISSKDLPVEMLQFAENKTKKLNEAYAKIKELK
jgi:hypothetical protein